MLQSDDNTSEERSNDASHVAVIGGGQSCRWLLFAFLEHLMRAERERPIARITVIEKRNAPGVGLAWGREDALDEHLATLPTPVSRPQYGDQQSVQFHRTLDALREVGITVDLWLGEVANMVCRSRNGYLVATAAGRMLEADIVVLAMGHGMSSLPSQVLTGFGLAEGPGLHVSPWPARTLQDAVFETPRPRHPSGHPAVLILGSYLTAIDTALSLALRAGRFLPDGENRLRFEANAEISIVLASRSGQLPSVWRWNRTEHTARATFGPDWMSATQRNGDAGPYVPLEAALELLAPAVGMASGAAPARARLRASIAQQCARDPGAVLRTQIATALREQGGSNLSTTTQAALVPSASDDNLRILSEISPHFCAEDQIMFDCKLRTSVFNILLPMALPAAMQIEALIRSRHLRVVSLGRSSAIRASSNALGLYELHHLDRDGVPSVEIFSDVVDGTSIGHGPWGANTEFLDRMAELGLAARGLRGFRSRAIASRLARCAGRRIVWLANSAWLQADGPFVDPYTCALSPDGRLFGHPATPRLFAMGAMLASQFVDARSLGQAYRDASRIATCIFMPSDPRSNEW